MRLSGTDAESGEGGVGGDGLGDAVGGAGGEGCVSAVDGVDGVGAGGERRGDVGGVAGGVESCGAKGEWLPSKKVTVPVAMVEVPVETAAERVTGWRALAGLGVAGESVVVGGPLRTV